MLKLQKQCQKLYIKHVTKYKIVYMKCRMRPERPSDIYARNLEMKTNNVR